MPSRRFAPTGDPALKTAARKQCLRLVKARGAPCYRCGKPIDYTLTSGRWRWVGDEVIPRHIGGRADDPTNVVASHWTCNAKAGARVTHAKRRAKRIVEAGPLTSRAWRR